MNQNHVGNGRFALHLEILPDLLSKRKLTVENPGFTQDYGIDLVLFDCKHKNTANNIASME